MMLIGNFAKRVNPDNTIDFICMAVFKPSRGVGAMLKPWQSRKSMLARGLGTHPWKRARRNFPPGIFSGVIAQKKSPAIYAGGGATKDSYALLFCERGSSSVVRPSTLGTPIRA